MATTRKTDSRIQAALGGDGDVTVDGAAGEAPTGRDKGRRRIRPGVVVFVAALVVTFLVAVMVALSGAGSSSESSGQVDAIAVGQGGPAVADPPAEWTGQPLWTTPPLLEAAGRLLVVDGDRVGMVTADRRVSIVTSAGEPVWTARLPEGEVTSSLAVTRIDGEPVVALQVGHSLLWWSVQTGEPGAAEVPAGSVITYLGDRPLIGLDPATVAVIQDGRLHRIAMPAGATAFAATTGGVWAASQDGLWNLADDSPTEPQPWQGLDGRPVVPVTWSDGRLITVQATPGSAEGHLVVFDEGSTSPAWAGDITVPGDQITWHAAPSGRWGVLGRTLVDLHQRTVRDLGQGWATTTVASDRALGILDTQRVLAGPSIEPGVLAADEGFPEDLIRLSGTEVGALVRMSTPPVQTVSVLAPRKQP